MKPLVIACSILEDEIGKIFADHGLEKTYDLLWLEDSLHNDPHKLGAVIEEQLALADDRPLVLLAYGNCGNGLVGVTTAGAPVIMPREADCISALLHDRGDVDDLRKRTYFLTRGWMNGSESLDVSYRRYLEKFGPEKTEKFIGALYGNYEDLMLIDTGAYDADALAPEHERLAGLYHLNPVRAQGSTGVFERLLLGPRDPAEFLHVEPHHTFTLRDFFDFGS